MMKSLIKYLGWMFVTLVCLIGFWLAVLFIIFGEPIQKVTGTIGLIAFFVLVVSIYNYKESKKPSYVPKHMARSKRK